MSIETTLLNRANHRCELCQCPDHLQVHVVGPHTELTQDHGAVVCQTCLEQLPDNAALNLNHWHCLNESAWSTVPAVQVLAWRLLSRLSENESWAQDLKNMLYLEDSTQKWADMPSTFDIPLVDAHGANLQTGDTVSVIKDLPVKGSSMVIKQGTVIRNIKLGQDGVHLQGKVNGTTLMVIAEYCKKQH